MNRRTLLKGLVATAAFVSVPAYVIKASSTLAGPARSFAIDRLHQAYVAYVVKVGRPPAAMVAGCDLTEMYEGELMASQRLVSVEMTWLDMQWLRFKAAHVISDGRGYSVRGVDEIEYAMRRTHAMYGRTA